MDSWGKARGHLYYPHKELHKSQAEISPMTREEQRLEQSRQRTAHWKRWGPYLSEREWGTVRDPPWATHVDILSLDKSAPTC